MNLPMSSMIPPEPNEAYIDNFSSKEKLRFIKAHKLGDILPEVGFSGYCTYAKVAFDMERLRDLDPKGVEEYLQRRKEQDALKKETKPKKRKHEQKER